MLGSRSLFSNAPMSTTKISSSEHNQSGGGRARKDKKAKYEKEKQHESHKKDLLATSVKDAECINEEVEEKGETVVHPWHLNKCRHKLVSDNLVIIDEGDQGGVYPIAKHADNITGKGLFRRELGEGKFSLPSDWSEAEYIERACAPLVGEAVGKNDMEMRLLVPAAVNNLRSWVEPWPRAREEILQHLLSDTFTGKVQRFQEQRVQNYRPMLRAKTLKLASEFGASVAEVDNALNAFLDDREPWRLYGLLASIVSLCASVDYVRWWYPMTQLVLVWSLMWYIRAFLAVAMFAILFIAFRRRLFMSNKERRLLSALRDEQVQVHYGALVSILPTCSRGVVLPPLLSCWKFTLNAGAQWKSCVLKKAYQTFGTFIEGASLVVPQGCHHDQYNGLAIRFFFQRTYLDYKLDQAIRQAQHFCIGLKGVWRLISYDEWVHHLASRRRKLLQNEPEATSLKAQIGVDIFVKLEAYLGKGVENFKPRIIQGRQLAYQNIVGPFFYSVSKWLGSALSRANGNLIYDAGLDALELGSIAQEMFARKKYVFEIDVTNWDGSLCPEWLKFEVWFVENVLPELPPRWRELRKHWCTVQGCGKEGVCYKTKHGRRSGDMWTSCFNSLINLMILYFIFGLDLLAVAKGDDNFFGTNKEITESEIVAIYDSLGMKAKVKKIDHISNLGYCSGTFWPVPDGWKWGVKPFRIISKLGLNLHRHPEKIHARLLYGTALSMLPIAAHVPFVGVLLESIVSSAQVSGIEPLFDEEPWKTTSMRIDTVNPAAYNIVACRYGLSESDIDTLNFALQYHVREVRPLQLSDFPIVFRDSRFTAGFHVDVEEGPVRTDHISIEVKEVPKIPAGRWLEFLLMCVFSPVAEEMVRRLFPVTFTLIAGIVESVRNRTPYNLVLHLVLLALARLGFPIALVGHLANNLLAFACRGSGLKYGESRMLSRRRRYERFLREEQGYLPLCLIVRLLDKDRLMDKATTPFKER